MHPLVARAVEVYRREGGRSLAGQTARYCYNQSLAWLRAARWRVRGVRPVTVGETTARFAVESVHESRELEFLASNETPIVEDLLAELRPGDVFYDVGGHVGFYSCLAGRAGATVVAFEPYPPNLERLEVNLALNDVDATVQPVALADEHGEIAFDQPDAATPGWSRSAIAVGDGTDDGDGNGRVTVRTDAGDRLVGAGEIPAPNVVKIDVEGAEGRVIDGMSETLAADECRLVYCEVHRPDTHRQSVADYGDSTDSIRTALADLGFDIESLYDREAEVTLRARK